MKSIFLVAAIGTGCAATPHPPAANSASGEEILEAGRACLDDVATRANSGLISQCRADYEAALCSYEFHSRIATHSRMLLPGNPYTASETRVMQRQAEREHAMENERYSLCTDDSVPTPEGASQPTGPAEFCDVWNRLDSGSRIVFSARIDRKTVGNVEAPEPVKARILSCMDSHRSQFVEAYDVVCSKPMYDPDRAVFETTKGIVARCSLEGAAAAGDPW